MPIGKVFLVGAGPGDPGLLTLRGVEALAAADCVVYDRLANPQLLKHTKPGAELIYAGKQSSRHALRQEEINAILVARASEGKVVCRLKGGDPFVFGRGGEEAEALVDAGIPFEVVPGVTSAVAVPAYAGIPVTHRDFCSALGIVTGHEDPSKEQSALNWPALAAGLDTLVFLMGVENLPNIVQRLLDAGRSPTTPVALIRWGTRLNQQTLVGTLGDIVERVRQTGFESPAVTVVGRVVALRDRLRWFDARPLFGKRILVTRTREQASDLVRRLEALGADVVELPTIRIEPLPVGLASVDLRRYHWIAFTSANAVHTFLQAVLAQKGDIRELGPAKLAAIGSATVDALRGYGLGVSFVPERAVAEALAEGFPGPLDGMAILIPQAQDARDVLSRVLRERGAAVDVLPVYQTVPNDPPAAAEVAEALSRGELDVLTFTSSSTVTNFVRLFGVEWLRACRERRPVIACIGPITAGTAAQLGLPVDIAPEQDYTVPGLVKAIESHVCTGEA